ncbi:MAG: hypothetical protein KAT66_00140 [Candidatus Lokiarchaeota archaeon]|nr:hypothetical protein [Candidatus Lokiarchaeota archaeon]
MAHILVTGWYPPNKAKEMVKVYTIKDKPTYPDFVKKINHWVTASTDGQIKVYAVYECPDDKIIDTMKAIAKRYTLYATVEGYRYYAELLMDAEEAIKLLL